MTYTIAIVGCRDYDDWARFEHEVTLWAVEYDGRSTRDLRLCEA